MADDYEIKDDKKAIEDLVKNYQNEKLINRKKEIINSLNNAELGTQEVKDLEKELHDIIIKLAQK